MDVTTAVNNTLYIYYNSFASGNKSNPANTFSYAPNHGFEVDGSAPTTITDWKINVGTSNTDMKVESKTSRVNT